MFLQNQSELIWKIKDALNSDLNNTILKEMLLANNQKAPSATTKVSMIIIIQLGLQDFYKT